MYVKEADLEAVVPVEAPGTGLRAGLRGLDRLESNVYQAAFEQQLLRALERSRLFATVHLDDFDPANVDLVIAVDKADLSVRRRINLAYFPLAIATLTLYIWVGGPIVTDTQYFDVALHASKPGSQAELFSVASRLDEDHWINLYSPEYWAQDAPCRGPAAGEVLADLVRQLGDGLRDRRIAVGPERR